MTKIKSYGIRLPIELDLTTATRLPESVLCTHLIYFINDGQVDCNGHGLRELDLEFNRSRSGFA
jgi:hypothetical protein